MRDSKAFVWIAAGVVVFSLHLAFEFVAWATAPGNSAHSDAAVFIWKIASFPLLTVMSRGGTNLFWEAMILNSAIWSVGLTLLAKRIATPRSTTS